MTEWLGVKTLVKNIKVNKRHLLRTCYDKVNLLNENMIYPDVKSREVKSSKWGRQKDRMVRLDTIVESGRYH